MVSLESVFFVLIFVFAPHLAVVPPARFVADTDLRRNSGRLPKLGSLGSLFPLDATAAL